MSTSGSGHGQRHSGRGGGQEDPARVREEGVAEPGDEDQVPRPARQVHGLGDGAARCGAGVTGMKRRIKNVTYHISIQIFL